MATATANAAQWKSKVGRVRSASLTLIWRSAYQKQAAAHDQLAGEEQRRGEGVPPIGRRCVYVVREPGRS
jgi:hypothetical protein